jgi:hypothetical protein
MAARMVGVMAILSGNLKGHSTASCWVDKMVDDSEYEMAASKGHRMVECLAGHLGKRLVDCEVAMMAALMDGFVVDDSAMEWDLQMAEPMAETMVAVMAASKVSEMAAERDDK